MSTVSKPGKEDLAATLASAGVSMETLRSANVDTLDEADSPADLRIRRTLQELPSLVAPGDADEAPLIEMGSVLGEGGMGVISAARQSHLDREVAVKVARSDSEQAALGLVREARVLGGLEHPNIPPVHLLGASVDGQPMLVMKRLDGVPWTRFMPGPDRELTAPVAGDALEWHLRVLQQVCNAVLYAHSHGVIHRDIKPDNVMVGEYGEVYLLDWGLAVSRIEDNPFGLPAAAQIAHVAGTPGYIAPEMVAADGVSIGERTDVYLLGGCLHTILTGEHRHQGDSVMDRLYQACSSPPYVHGEDVPRELAAIGNRATAEEPVNRYRDAAEFRDALEDFLRHRASAALAREAVGRVHAFCHLVEEGAGPEDGEEELSMAMRVHGLYGECRFGIDQALREWEGNPVASVALQRLLGARIRYELASGSADTASVLLAEMPRPDTELRDMVAFRRQQDAEEAERLASLQHRWDLELGMRGRSRALLGIGVLWGVVYVVLGQLARADVFRAEYGTFLLVSVVHGGVIGGLDLFMRRTMPRTEANRRFIQTLWITVVAPALTLLALLVQEVPFPTALGVVLLVYGLTACIAAIAIDLRMLGTAVLFGVGFVVTALAPTWCYEAAAGAAFLGLALAAHTWRTVDTPG